MPEDDEVDEDGHSLATGVSNLRDLLGRYINVLSCVYKYLCWNDKDGCSGGIKVLHAAPTCWRMQTSDASSSGSHKPGTNISLLQWYCIKHYTINNKIVVEDFSNARMKHD